MAVLCANVEQLLNINSLGFSLGMGSICSSTQELNVWVDEDLDLLSSTGNDPIVPDSQSTKKTVCKVVSAGNNDVLPPKDSNSGASELASRISTLEFGDDKENVDPQQFVYSSDVGFRQTAPLHFAPGKRIPLQDITSKLNVTSLAGNSSTTAKKVRPVTNSFDKALNRKYYLR